ncbi:MAG: hypothetical protein K9M54_11290 [Kiritimatiellales bacterium]|nr:hypothetical protein [Kiritimatiellales bacterium]MCF7864086.1 hypothetical protein [Kiritimatiellales bacterium]
MKIKKALKIILLGLVSLAVVLTVVMASVFFFWLGPTVKLIAENIGTKALGTPVAVKQLSINPRKGTIDLVGFQIGMPEAFNQSNTCSLAKFHVSVDVHSVFTDTIVVHEIRIESPHFTYEQNAATDNIAELVRHIGEFAGIDPNAPKSAEPKAIEPEDALEKAPKQVIVERLVINDVQMNLANTGDPQLDIQLRLEQLSLSLTNGVVQLSNLALSNPRRLETPNLFQLESITVKLDPASIYSGKVVIEDVQIVKPYAFLEQNPATGTVAEFMKIADAFTTKAAAKPKATATATAVPEPNVKTEPAPPPVELRNLLVDDIQLKLLDTTRTNAPAGPYTLASIGSISVKPIEGSIKIGTITIPNLPAGFTTTNLLHLAGIDIAIDPASIYSDQIVIKTVLVDSPSINLEQTDATGNVSELQKLAEGFAPPTAATVATAPPDVPMVGTTNQPVRLADQPVVLESLVVTNFVVNMVTPLTTNNWSPSSIAKNSIGMLNPMNMLNGGDTNATAAADDTLLQLIAFDLLTLEPLKGLVQISNLRVGNPKGFANKNIVMLDRFMLDLDPDTLQSGTMLIRDILIEKPRIAYERQFTTDNIQSLQAFIKAATEKRKEDRGEATPAQPPVAATEAAPAAPGPKVIITHLLVKDGLVKAKLSALPSAPIPLPDIEMNDLGKETGGTSVGEALSKIGTTLYDAIIGSVSSVTGFAGDALKGAGALTFGALGTVTGGMTDSLGASLGIGGQPKEKISEEPDAESPSKNRRRSSNWRQPGRSF